MTIKEEPWGNSSVRSSQNSLASLKHKTSHDSVESATEKGSHNEDSHSLRSLKPGEVFENAKGLGWFVTGLFVVGDLAGGGIVALPTAVIQSGFAVGLVLMVVMTFIVTFTAYVLGRSWSILLERWPEYRHHTRKPYAEIGYRACGQWMKILVSIVTNITQFMIAVVYIELSSKNIEDLIKAFASVDFSFCLVILCLAVCLLPITFLKSPNDFWWAVVIAMFTTSAAVVLIIVGSALDYGTCSPIKHMPKIKVTNYFLALGTFLFAYGGHTAFPTIQHDMKRPSDFTKSVIVAFSIMALMYLPTGIMGYEAYGDSLRSSVINSIQVKGIQQAINILITIHLILTLTIVFNPLNQEIEELFNVPQNFSWKRAVVRTSIMILVVFVAESVPSFGPLLDLVGGSTLTLSSVVFPCLFYAFIEARKQKILEFGRDDGPVSIKEVFKYNPWWMCLACIVVMIFGILGGCAATYSAILELTTTQFQAPCWLFQHKASTAVGSTNCCGQFQNITAQAGVVCTAPELDFYN